MLPQEFLIKNLEEFLAELDSVPKNIRNGLKLEPTLPSLTLIAEQIINYFYNDPDIVLIIKMLLDSNKRDKQTLEKLHNLMKNFLLGGSQNSRLFVELFEKSQLQKIIEDFKENPFNFYTRIPSDILQLERIKRLMDATAFRFLIDYFDEGDRKHRAGEIIRQLLSDDPNLTTGIQIEKLRQGKTEIVRLLCADLIEQDIELFECYKQCTKQGLIDSKQATNFDRAWKTIESWKEPWLSFQLVPANAGEFVQEIRFVLYEIIRAIRRGLDFSYWVKRYVERTNHFSKIFVRKFTMNIDDNGTLREDLLTQDILQYLHDNGIPFSWNEQKEIFRPDISTTHTDIEVKVVFPDEKEVKIINKLKAARHEIEQELGSHQIPLGLILIFNCSREYRLLSINEERLKIIDLYGALTSTPPSKDTRPFLKIGPDPPFIDKRN